jgi:catechol 2,3-dioxygenase-like lactoylglutathione lyase family enzyme
VQTAIRGIDHVVVLVRDLDAARDAYERLGFAPTPRGFHSIGTQNHCLMFGTDYLELLSVITPHPVTEYFSSFIAKGDGAGGIAFASDDADAAHAGFVAAGIAADPPVNFSRPVDLPEGRIDARFRVVQLPADATPGCRTFVCQHFTPHAVWRPEYQRHPNGVMGIRRIVIGAPDPAAAAASYARVAGGQPDVAGEALELRVGDAAFRFERSEAAEPRLQELQLAVKSRDVAAAALSAGGVAFTRGADGALRVDARQAHGVALTFI